MTKCCQGAIIQIARPSLAARFVYGIFKFEAMPQEQPSLGRVAVVLFERKRPAFVSDPEIDQEEVRVDLYILNEHGPTPFREVIAEPPPQV